MGREQARWDLRICFRKTDRRGCGGGGEAGGIPPALIFRRNGSAIREPFDPGAFLHAGLDGSFFLRLALRVLPLTNGAMGEPGVRGSSLAARCVHGVGEPHRGGDPPVAPLVRSNNFHLDEKAHARRPDRSFVSSRETDSFSGAGTGWLK